MSKYPVLNIGPSTTAQEVFDAVCLHLKNQGGPAASLRSYVNRTPDGRACAAACLMTDDEAQEYEGLSFKERVQAKTVPSRLQQFQYLILRLQAAHDAAAYHKGIARHLQAIADDCELQLNHKPSW